MKKHCENEKRFGKENGWRLTVRIKGKGKWDAQAALTEVLYRIEKGDQSGAESTDTHAYIFKLEAER